MKKSKLTPWLLLTPFLAVTALVVVSVWNILVQSLGVIPAFGLMEPTIEYYRQVLTDETFSVVSSTLPPEGVSRRDYCLWVSLLDYSYWVGATAVGALFGNFLHFNTAGMDFALTALFVVLFLEQWKKKENRFSGLAGIGCAAVALAVFGAENMVIPAMVMILAVLLGRRTGK